MAREMKNSGIPWISEIPTTWKTYRHKHVMHKEKSICSHYSGEDIISLTMNGVIIRDLSAGGKMPTSFDGYQFVEPEDLLLCLFDIDVTPRCVGLVKNYGVTSPAYSRFKVHEGFYNAYYDYLLRTIDDKKVFVHLSKNLRNSLTESDFGLLPTIAPPIEEQHRIASFLDTECSRIDAVIDQTRASIEEYKKLKQSVITQAVTKGIRPGRKMKDSGIEWIGEIPEEWTVSPIKRILAEQTTKTATGEGIQLSVNQKKGVVKSSESGAANPSLSTIGWKNVAVNDIVFNKYKAHSGVFFVSEYEGIVTFNYSVFRCINNNWPKYFEYQFKTDGCIGEFKKQMRGVGESISPLYTKDLFKIIVAVPVSLEQQEIAEFLNEKLQEIDTLIYKKELLILELELLKKSLLY